MQSIKTVFIVAFILVTTSAIAAIPAMALDSNWTITGQVRPRFEYRNGYRNLLPPATTDGVVFISQRTRIGVLYKGEAKAKAFVQVQDVRTWGDETHTSTDATADKFDLHQGYVDLIPNENWSMRIGRQEIAYDEDRLLGTGNWNQSGRSHDAILAMWKTGIMSVHAAWAHHEKGDPVLWTPYPNGLSYQDLAIARITGECDQGRVSLYIIYDSYDRTYLYTNGGFLSPNRWTMGTYSKLGTRRFVLRGEGYYQTGKIEEINEFYRRLDIGAYMLGLSATYNAKPGSATLWYDYLSGDSDDDDDRFGSFDPLYGTFHRFYGWADYFISFPGDTRGLGLQDLALKFAIDGPRDAKTQVDLHYFWLAEQLPGFNVNNRHLGFEADVMVTIPLLKSLSLSGGASLVLPTQTMRTLKGQADQGHWVWTMLDFNVK